MRLRRGVVLLWIFYLNLLLRSPPLLPPLANLHGSWPGVVCGEIFRVPLCLARAVNWVHPSSWWDCGTAIMGGASKRSCEGEVLTEVSLSKLMKPATAAAGGSVAAAAGSSKTGGKLVTLRNRVQPS